MNFFDPSDSDFAKTEIVFNLFGSFFRVLQNYSGCWLQHGRRLETCLSIRWV